MILERYRTSGCRSQASDLIGDEMSGRAERGCATRRALPQAQPQTTAGWVRINVGFHETSPKNLLRIRQAADRSLCSPDRHTRHPGTEVMLPDAPAPTCGPSTRLGVPGPPALTEVSTLSTPMVAEARTVVLSLSSRRASVVVVGRRRSGPGAQSGLSRGRQPHIGRWAGWRCPL